MEGKPCLPDAEVQRLAPLTAIPDKAKVSALAIPLKNVCTRSVGL